MTVSEALNRVGMAYVPGVAAHYERMENNPWQKAHDDLERIMLMKDEAFLRVGVDRFVSECLRLIQAFEAVSRPSDRMTNQDAFIIGDEDRVRQWQSRKFKHCFKCESKENLTLIHDPKDAKGVLIICNQCKQKRSA